MGSGGFGALGGLVGSGGFGALGGFGAACRRDAQGEAVVCAPGVCRLPPRPWEAELSLRGAS